MSDSLEPKPPTDVPREAPRTVLFQFVIFPLLVVLIGVGVFLLFGMIAHEEHSIPEYLNAIQSGSSHRRWQAAYQLSKSLKRGEAKNYPDLAEEVARLYQAAKKDDPKIRRYLSMVLGTLGDRRGTAVLIDGLNDRDPETRIYALWALAEIRDPKAVPAIVSLTSDEDRDIRKTAVYALGRIGDSAAVPALVGALGDSAEDVRWNAALALAQLRDPRALGPLREMLDRTRLDQFTALRPDQKEIVMINAISAYSDLAGSEAVPQLEKLADSDPSLRVRATARDALSRLR
jgi:HEAT repeat protein